MALWSDHAAMGLRRLRALFRHMPPDSVTALLAAREGGSRMSEPEPEPKRFSLMGSTPAELQAWADANGVPIGVHHG